MWVCGCGCVGVGVWVCGCVCRCVDVWGGCRCGCRCGCGCGCVGVLIHDCIPACFVCDSGLAVFPAETFSDEVKKTLGNLYNEQRGECKIRLSGKDDLYTRLRDLHIQEIGPFVRRELADLQEYFQVRSAGRWRDCRWLPATAAGVEGILLMHIPPSSVPLPLFLLLPGPLPSPPRPSPRPFLSR